MTQKFFSPTKTYVIRDVHLLDDLQEICGELDNAADGPGEGCDFMDYLDIFVRSRDAIEALLASMSEAPVCKG
jgi:hypothetical protein